MFTSTCKRQTQERLFVYILHFTITNWKYFSKYIVNINIEKNHDGHCQLLDTVWHCVTDTGGFSGSQYVAVLHFAEIWVVHLSIRFHLNQVHFLQRFIYRVWSEVKSRTRQTLPGEQIHLCLCQVLRTPQSWRWCCCWPPQNWPSRPGWGRNGESVPSHGGRSGGRRARHKLERWWWPRIFSFFSGLGSIPAYPFHPIHSMALHTTTCHLPPCPFWGTILCKWHSCNQASCIHNDPLLLQQKFGYPICNNSWLKGRWEAEMRIWPGKRPTWVKGHSQVSTGVEWNWFIALLDISINQYISLPGWKTKHHWFLH